MEVSMPFDFLVTLSLNECYGYMASFTILGGFLLGAAIPKDGGAGVPATFGTGSRILFSLSALFLVPSLVMAIAFAIYGPGKFGVLFTMIVILLLIALIASFAAVISLWVTGNVTEAIRYQRVCKLNLH